MADLIDRQAAIETAVSYIEEWNGAQSKFHRNRITERFLNLPSAQTEIIRCKDCKYAKWDDERGDYICNGRAVWKNHYCGYAKRRGEEHESS